MTDQKHAQPSREGGEQSALRTHRREADARGNVPGDGMTGEGPYSQTVSTKLNRLKELARDHPTRVFTSIHHLIDLDFLKEAYRQTNRSAAAGVDGVTAKVYAEHLDANLNSLLQRYRDGSYRAPPVKRVWIDKEDGSQRPLGIPALEDKILQRAVAMLLSALYNVDFYGYSFGFREKRSAHQAIQYLRDQCNRQNVSVIIDADVSQFFDHLSHEHLRNILKWRVKDGKIIRFIGKWLRAGVMEDNHLRYPDQGSPQGGSISPLLANIYLHHVLDDWYEKEVKPRLYGRSFIVRFADDFVIGCEHPHDGERLMKVLPKRFAKFDLTIHPEKSKQIAFRRPPHGEDKSGTGTFDFLGFTHFWGKSRNGNWVIKRKTSAKRMRRAMKNLWLYCRNSRHQPLVMQHKELKAKLLGLYNYYGIIGNYKMLEVLFEHARRAWKRWLARRSRSGVLNYEKFERLWKVWPLPKPRITKQV